MADVYSNLPSKAQDSLKKSMILEHETTSLVKYFNEKNHEKR